MRALVARPNARKSFLAVSTFLGVFVAGVFAMFAHDLASARAAVRGRTQTFDTQIGTLEYAMIGDGEPLLTIHGAGGGFDQAIDMTASLATRGYRLIAPSRFGYLASTLPTNATTAMQADVYAQLLDRLGIKSVVILAISAGEWSGLQFAVRHPRRCRAVVLVAPASPLPPRHVNYGGPLVRWMVGSDVVTWASVKLAKVMPGAMSETLLGTDASLVRSADDGERARLQRILGDLLPMSARASGMRFDIETARAPESLAFERITCPVLAISAADDRFGTATRAQYIAESVRDGKAIIYSSGGHALVGRQAELLRDITSFLLAVAPRQSKT